MFNRDPQLNSGASAKVMSHMSQLITSGQYQRFDFRGDWLNQLTYG
jgi:hypothetical protein